MPTTNSSLWTSAVFLLTAGCGSSSPTLHSTQPALPTPTAMSEATPAAEESAEEVAHQCAPLAAGEEGRVQAPAPIAVQWADVSTFARCAPNTPPHNEARQALSALDNAIKSTAIDAAPAALRQQLLALLALPCFAVASESDYLPTATTVESLATWWRQGGLQWLEQYLTPMPRRANNDWERSVVLPPDEPRVLSEATLHANHPLRRVLCAVNDTECEAETQPFRVRLEAMIASEQDRAMQAPEQDGFSRAERLRECERRAQTEAARPDDRYFHWRDCVESLRYQAPQMPIVHARAPHSGWLIAKTTQVLEGPTRICDELCAYDFATGAAHCARECARSDGSERTDATVRRGNVELGLLRELGWATLLADDIDIRAKLVTSIMVPHDWLPQWRQTEFSGMGWGGAGGGCNTILSLSWVENGCVLFDKLFAVSSPDDAVERYVGTLHRVMASSMSAGAPRAPVRGLAVNLAAHDHEQGTRLIRALSDSAHP